MKIGFQLRYGPARWLNLVQTAERVGFESIWLPEHLILPVQMKGEPGNAHDGDTPISGKTPAWDPWLQITHLAAHTTTMRFGTNVYNIGLRHPFSTARALTTVDLLSNGRVDFGIGASWLAAEWEATELDFATRGRRVDESIEIITRLFTEDVVEHHGEFFNFQPVQFEPKPVQRPRPMFHIGGDSPAAMRRAAKLGDGWIPMSQTLETLPGNLARISSMRQEAGHETPLEITIFSPGEPTADLLQRFRDLGVNRVILAPWWHPREMEQTLSGMAERFLPLLA